MFEMLCNREMHFHFGGSKNRNPLNPPKFTKSNIYC